ncbi:MAG: outer membrane beta-barrel protein [Thiolinea sp.]
MKNKSLIYGSFIFLLSTPLLAGGLQTGGSAYIGAGVGKTHSNADVNDFTSPSYCHHAKSKCRADKNDQSWQLYGGYKVSPFMAVEGAYVNLGQTANLSDGKVRGTQDTKGVSLSAVGKVPMGAASVYGKAGVYHWNSDVTLRHDQQRERADGSGTDPVIGAGLEYQFNERWSGRVGWDRYYNVGKSNDMINKHGVNTLKTDVDVYGVGLSFDF